METQAHMDMAHGEIREERTNEPTEEIREMEKEFLKDLYVFMKKRDTPIERIPNLGFKQIDLFLMFKTVRDLGGYHQVTAQQLWKQVYNMLGGNPRSTSAATCTRRHYEKLLLPYECHVKGISMSTFRHHQPRHFHYGNYSKDDDDGQRPAKRKLLSVPPCQNMHTPQGDGHGSAFLVPLQYPHYYHPNPAVMPPHMPISSSVLAPNTPPAPEPRFPFNHYGLNPTERAKEPLEHLRYLAERYKTSSGLIEPLNLSVKASRQDSINYPASSFAPPLSSKNPKFLNKPSPLYTRHCPQVVRNERCEAPEGEARLGDAPYSYPEKYDVDVKAVSGSSSSPTYESALTLRPDEGAIGQSPSSPKTDFTVRQKEERQGSLDLRGLDLSHILPGLPPENSGEMEIEIPLSVFHNWLKLCRSSATMHEDKQLPTPPALEEHSGQSNCSDADVPPTNLTFRLNPQQQSSVAEDLRVRQRNVPSPTPNIQTTGYLPNMSQNPFTSYKPLPPGGILKNAASRDVFPFDQQDVNKSYSTKPPHCWDAYEQKAHPLKPKLDSNPLTVQQNFAASKSYIEDTVQAGKEKSEMGPSAVLMLNSSSTSLLHLTTEEVMKLKKIISSSS
ncbi:AT-rich interaction domain 6 [Chaetodon auriga]|uniref:AT-rich interaction domain 6 n=1 Tax=Chaetodon auriga TaxID=39042 RepID=UPI004032B846